MLIAVDIGNTNIVFGIYQKENLVKKWRFISDQKKSVDDFAVDLIEVLASEKIDLGKISAVIIASVVPVLSDKIKQAFIKFCDCEVSMIGDKNIKIDLEIDLKNKSEIGDDRIINSVAAIEKYGFPIQIIDFGTATTIDVVSKDRKYLGGVIAPGINLSLKALHDMTAKLPKIEIKKQSNVIGKNTVEAINSGVYFGYISLIEGLVEKIEKELGYQTKKVITGGLSSLFADSLFSNSLFSDSFSSNSDNQKIDLICCPDLTLDGLCYIYRQNLKKNN
jgi:type III pantothenate kinase